MMTDVRSQEETEVLHQQGYQIRLIPSGPEWMAFVAQPQRRPTLIMALDREAVLAKAHEWIEAQRTAKDQE